MIKLPNLLTISILAICTSANADDAMSVRFTFGSPRACTTMFPNPEIKVQHVPVGTSKILVKLRREKNYEMGGMTIPLPSNGIVKPDTVRTWGPCNPGVYTYEVTAMSGAGTVLARAEWSEPYLP